MKRLFLLLILLSSAVCADDYFPVGFWQPPEKVDEAFFKTIADGNFTLVFSNRGNQLKNLDMAKAVGMKGIVYDYPSVLKNLNDNNRQATLTNLATTHSKHEALWGYYLCDEAKLEQFPALKTAADADLFPESAREWGVSSKLIRLSGSTVRSTRSSSRKSMGLARKPSKPAARKADRAWLAALAVRATMGTFFQAAAVRMRCMASIPSIPGIMWSMNTRSKVSRLHSSMASGPEAAVETCMP